MAKWEVNEIAQRNGVVRPIDWCAGNSLTFQNGVPARTSRSERVSQRFCGDFQLEGEVLLHGAMDGLTVSAVSGMKARLESLSLLANNIANSSSAGYKADSELYSLYTSELADTGQAPLIERRWTDFTQGTPIATGNSTDVALRGDGFFQVAGPDGDPLLTRNGAFLVGPGGRLETQDGRAVLATGGGPIEGLDPRMPIDIGAAGEIRQSGREIARLSVVQASEPASLEKRGALYFSSNQPGATVTPAQAEVLQGRLETANISAPVAAVRLIDVLRQFETLQKAIQINSEMGQRLEEVARVGN